MKTRYFLPALLSVGLLYAALASNASAFELLNRMMGHGGGCCHNTCGCEPTCCPEPCCPPTCGCEPTCCPEPCCPPTCGCEPACCPPACGCEPSCCPEPCCDSCCDHGCKKRRVGLLQRLFARCKDKCCAPKCCEPACCPAPCAPTCGCGY